MDEIYETRVILDGRMIWCTEGIVSEDWKVGQRSIINFFIFKQYIYRETSLWTTPYIFLPLFPCTTLQAAAQAYSARDSWRGAISAGLVKPANPPRVARRTLPAYRIRSPSLSSSLSPSRVSPSSATSSIDSQFPPNSPIPNQSSASNSHGNQVCSCGRSAQRPPPQAGEAGPGRGAGYRDKIYRKIGEGTFGQVLECWDRENKEMVAIKVVRAVKEYSDAAMIEIDVLQKLTRNDAAGKHCVQIRNWFDYRNHICIVCEKLGPSLYDFLRKTGYRPFPIDLVRRIGEQLLESVAFMHRLQLIHTDLKPENILLVSSDYVKLPDPKDGSFSRKLPKSSAIKLIDFGSTAYHHQDRSYIVSTRHYRAPEVILGRGWSYPCDMWSVGCILVELCSGETLFQTHENLEHLAMMERVLGPVPRHMLEKADHHAEKYVRRGRLNWPEGATTRESIRAVLKLPRLQNLVMQHVDHSAGDFIDLLKGLLAYEPSNRMTAQEALSHRFFTKYGDRRSL